MSVTLANAFKNAQTVLNDRTKYCLTTNFEVTTDLSRRATMEQLTAKIKDFPKIDGRASKPRLVATLNLIYPSPMQKAVMPKKSEALGEKAVATCRASIVAQAKASRVSVVDRSKQLVQKSKEIPLVKDTSPQGGVTFSNESFGNFALMPRVLKALIADYLGDSMSWDRAKFVQAYPDMNAFDQSKELPLVETQSMEGILEHMKLLKELYKESPAQLSDVNFKTVVKGCKSIKEFCISGPLNEDHFEVIAKLPPNTVICFDYPKFSDKELAKFAKRFPRIYGIRIKSSKITDKGLKAIAENCRQLQLLELNFSEVVWSYKGLDDLLESCKHLQKFVVVSDNKEDPYYKMFAIARCKKLKVLEVSRCRTFNWAHFSEIAQNCKELQELHINDCSQVTRAGLEELSKYKDLQVLSLLNCKFIDNYSLAALHNCANLRKIILQNLPYVTEEGIDELWRHLPNLKEIVVLK